MPSAPRSASSSTSSNRQWASSAKTRRQILDAARDLFSEFGYEQTSINDVTARSGVSSGSIYHHIGGKAEVFREVATEVIALHGEASKIAVASAREGGLTGTVELFLHGARAYLIASWETRGITRIIHGDNQPEGSREVQEALSIRILSGMRDITIGDPPTEEASSHAIHALLSAASKQTITIEDENLATALIDYYVGLVRELARA